MRSLISFLFLLISFILLTGCKSTIDSFNNYIKTLTAIYDTKRIGKIYMPAYRKRQDWGLWFNILNKTEEAYCFSESLAFYRTSNTSLSKDKIKLLRENFNFYRFFLKKNIVTSFLMMILFLVVHFSFKFFSNKKVSKII